MITSNVFRQSNVFRRQAYFVVKRISSLFENELHRTINDFEICYLFSLRQLFLNRIDNDVIVKFSRRRWIFFVDSFDHNDFCQFRVFSILEISLKFHKRFFVNFFCFTRFFFSFFCSLIDFFFVSYIDRLFVFSSFVNFRFEFFCYNYVHSWTNVNCLN